MKTRLFRLLASFTGGLYATLAALLVAVAFLFLSHFSHALAGAPFMRIHPRLSGGEARRSFAADGAFWTVHRPVFDGLVGERDEGFVQTDVELFHPGTKAHAPIDFDGDGTPDFTLTLPESGAPVLSGNGPNVAGLGLWSRRGESATIRVLLHKHE